MIDGGHSQISPGMDFARCYNKGEALLEIVRPPVEKRRASLLSTVRRHFPPPMSAPVFSPVTSGSVDTRLEPPATMVLDIGGVWELEHEFPDVSFVTMVLDRHSPKRLRFDASSLNSWHSGLVAFLLQSVELARHGRLSSIPVGCRAVSRTCSIWPWRCRSRSMREVRKRTPGSRNESDCWRCRRRRRLDSLSGSLGSVRVGRGLEPSDGSVEP